MFRLDKKICLVTGGSSGIGEAIASAFVQQGATVIVLDQKAGHLVKVEYREADVTNLPNIQKIVDGVVATRRTIDVLVNCAGIAHVGNLESTTPADLDRLFNVNVKGTYHCMQAVIPTMKKQQRGVILNLASIAASVGLADRFAYSMTKGAVYAMTLSVAKDYLPFGIRCNCISPARVHTPFVDGFLRANYPGREAEMFDKLSKTQPIGRMAQPAEVAHLAVYLCSDEAGFVTGTDYPIDGGFIKLNT
jgi:NAD(P)-dependent dehydrogenase (short-subunit alcohol dehydrogenase family)